MVGALQLGLSAHDKEMLVQVAACVSAVAQIKMAELGVGGCEISLDASLSRIAKIGAGTGEGASGFIEDQNEQRLISKRE